ncbi:MAG: hypothetical protein NPIRA06_27550 [Nitrospirales bacterium]|nr:MAG: hypothetical protein NPIRA06_27550 [Nitrospirales bacterium]
MTKRRTIGINPLDETIPNPLGAAIPDQHDGPDQLAHQEAQKQGIADKTAGQHSVPDRVQHDKKEVRFLHLVSRDEGPQGRIKSSQAVPATAPQVRIEMHPATGQLSERLVELEEENLCLKWALGLILSPLVLLALLG